MAESVGFEVSTVIPYPCGLPSYYQLWFMYLLPTAWGPEVDTLPLWANGVSTASQIESVYWVFSLIHDKEWGFQGKG